MMKFGDLTYFLYFRIFVFVAISEFYANRSIFKHVTSTYTYVYVSTYMCIYKYIHDIPEACFSHFGYLSTLTKKFQHTSPGMCVTFVSGTIRHLYIGVQKQ